jgi:hypothetical protein
VIKITKLAWRGGKIPDEYAPQRRRNTMTTSPWEPQPWLGATTLESVLEVNEQALALLRAQCQAGGGAPLLQAVKDLLLNLDAQALRRAAASPVMLVDAGFGEGGSWSCALVGAINDRPQVEAPPFFTVDGSVALMRLVVTQAWHLSRSQPAAARLLLGMSAANLAVIGGCTLSRLTRLAEARSHWLRPRWEQRTGIWCDLLRMAADAEDGALERLRLRGFQLLAADARPG